MKIKWLISIICFIVFVAMLIAFIPSSFSKEDYAVYFSKYAYDGNVYVNPIGNKIDAYSFGKELIDSTYSTLGYGFYIISYDRNSECWHIQRKVWRTYLGYGVGGCAHIIIQSDGKILAMWIER